MAHKGGHKDIPHGKGGFSVTNIHVKVIPRIIAPLSSQQIHTWSWAGSISRCYPTPFFTSSSPPYGMNPITHHNLPMGHLTIDGRERNAEKSVSLISILLATSRPGKEGGSDGKFGNWRRQTINRGKRKIARTGLIACIEQIVAHECILFPV